MTTKKTVTKKPATYENVTISNCSVTNISAANEYTRDAVVALARAIEANAVAVQEAARALRGSPASLGAGIHVGGGE